MFLVFVGFFGGSSKIYPLLEPLLLQADEVAKKAEVRPHATSIILSSRQPA